MKDVEVRYEGQPHDEDGPVFCAPWEAQAFAMAVDAHQRGLFSWSEWAQMLATEIGPALDTADADSGSTYYQNWLAALEKLVVAKGASTFEELSRYEQAWKHAAERTPHGQPLALHPEDFEN